MIYFCPALRPFQHPFLFPYAEPDNCSREFVVEASGKMVVLEKLLKKLYAGKHRVLIFSSFTSMLDILERFCQLRRYKYLRLDGNVNRVQRKFDMARFNGSNEYFIYLVR